MSIPGASCVRPAESRCALGERIQAGLASRRVQDLLAAALLMVLPFAIYVFLWWPTGHQTLGMDYLWARPGQQLLFMQAVRDGFFPLWAPADAGGIPFASYLCAGQYWPATWLMMTLEITYDGLQVELLTAIRLLMLGLSGFFTYLLVRRLGLGASAGVFAATVFIFSFRMLDAFRYGFELDTVVWFPVVVYLMERVVARPSLHHVAALALASYIMITAGHTQSAVYCIGFANVYLLVRALILLPSATWRERSRWLAGRVVCALGGQALAAGLCAVMVLPMLADVLPTWTDRTLGGAAYRAEGHMRWQDLLCNVFYPWLANVHSGFYGSQAVWLLTAVTATCLIRGWGRWGRRDRLLLVFLMSAVVLSIIYALGPLTPMREWIDAVSPGFVRMFRNPGRAMTVAVFAMALLVAFTVDGIVRYDQLRHAVCRVMVLGCTAYLLAGSALALALIGGAVRWEPKCIGLPLLGEATGYTPAAIHDDPSMLAVMAATILCVAAANSLAIAFWRRRRFSGLWLIACLVVVMLIEAHLYHRRGTWLVDGRFHTPASATFRQADTYHTRTLHPLPFYIRVETAVKPSHPGGGIRVCDRATGAVKELLAHGGAPAWRIYHQTVPGHEMPRAYVTPGVMLVRGDDLAAMTWMDPYATSVIDVSDSANATILEDARLADLNTGVDTDPTMDTRAQFAKLNNGLSVIEYTFNKATFRVSTDQPGLFNFSDRYAAGWRAAIDGREVPVYRSNHAFKAISLPPGEHKITFWYDPPSFRKGLMITLASVCVLLGLAGASVGRHARARILLATLAVALAIPGTWLTHDKIYAMVYGGGTINYDRTAPRLPFPDYADYLSTGAIGPVSWAPHTPAPSDGPDEQPAVPACAGSSQP